MRDSFVFGLCVGFFLFFIAILVLIMLCENKELKRCFMQEPKTKECEYVLWRYENRDKTSTVAVPVVVGR